MNPNPSTSSNQSLYPPQSFSQPTQIGPSSPSNQYTININSNSQPTYQYYEPTPTISNNYLSAQSQSDSKDKNKMINSKSSQAFISLSSLARAVNDPVAENKLFDIQGAAGNANEKYSFGSNKLSTNGNRDYKMASSAIFPSNQNQLQFNRFPAFDLSPGNNLSKSPLLQPSQASNADKNQNGVPKSNQSAKQKRQRELMQIKKQLDELNKKMILNTEKNKNNSTSNYSQLEVRPPKNSGIAQSAIFQTSNNYSQNFMNFDTKYNQPPKQVANPTISLDQLYSQKKNNETVKSNKNIDEFSSDKKYNYTPSTQFTSSNNYGVTQPQTQSQRPTNLYQMPAPSNNYAKPYEFQRKTQEFTNNKKTYQPYQPTYNSSQQSSSSYSNESNLPKKQVTSPTYTPTSTSTTSYAGYNTTQTSDKKPAYQNDSLSSPSYMNYGISSSSSTSSGSSNSNSSSSGSSQYDKNYNYSYKPQNNSSSTQQMTQNYMDIKPQSVTSSTSTSTFNQPQPQTQAYNFSKPAYTQTNATEVGGFKKKKGPALQPYDLKSKDLKQPIYDASTSATNHHSQQSSIRRTQSISYQDYSQPLKQLRNFKVTDFAMGKKMGKGQFGQVMLVRHKQTGWVCGLKVMNKKQIKDQDYVGQIARELSIQFYLTHRNIAQLFGYFEDEKNFYLLIQFCTGGQLLQKLKVQRRMCQRDVSLIIRQVCQGVDYIHKQQIIHRDIKPQNILFNYGIVKISDFGWAVYRGFGMRKTASGSPLYYPPEIVKGESYDDKIDIWCIGMMAYQCIIGKIPFKVYTQLDLGRIVSDQITFPEWVDVTDEAKDFILKTMKKKGEERMEIKQMLRHPFITKHQQKQLSPAILDEFKKVLGG